MILSKRERYAGIGAAVVLGVLIFDYYLLEPLLATRAQLVTDTTTKTQARLDGLDQLKKRKDVDKRWADMTDKNGLRADPETQITHAVLQWGQESSLSITGIKPERTEPPKKDKPFQERIFRVTASGNMRTITTFLWRVQSTMNIPVKIVDLQITAKKEGTDDLIMQVGISTLFWSPDYERPVKTAASIVPRDREEK